MTKQIEISFFNTIHLSGEELKEATDSCNRQEKRVLKIMEGMIGMTPFDVQQWYNQLYDEVPVTSIRRCMTVLTKKGKLEKLDEMKEGNYGKPNHKWRIK